jgi:hypothetical protein
MRIFKSEDEENKFIHLEEEDFVACFAFGEWFDHKVIDLSKLQELDAEEYYYDVLAIVRQAKRALSRCY